jgi:hypothetical protein
VRGGGGTSDLAHPGLTDRREVVAVLRLIVSATGGLVFGEAIDPETERGHRFNGWHGLELALHDVIEEAGRRRAADITATNDEET